MDKTLVRISGTVIMILLGVIAYFLQNMDKSIQKSTESIQELKIEMTQNKGESDKNYELFSDKLTNMERRVCNIEQELKDFRPKFKTK